MPRRPALIAADEDDRRAVSCVWKAVQAGAGAGLCFSAPAGVPSTAFALAAALLPLPLLLALAAGVGIGRPRRLVGRHRQRPLHAERRVIAHRADELVGARRERRLA